MPAITEWRVKPLTTEVELRMRDSSDPGRFYRFDPPNALKLAQELMVAVGQVDPDALADYLGVVFEQEDTAAVVEKISAAKRRRKRKRKR